MSKVPSRKSNIYSIREQFKYGLEYETLVYSPKLHALHETERENVSAHEQELLANGLYEFEDCTLTTDIYNSENHKEQSIPYRKFIKESIESRAASLPDINTRFEWSTYNCPRTQKTDEWIVTFDGSVEVNPDGAIPLYHSVDDLIRPNKSELLPAQSKQDIVPWIEIVSPPITWAQVQAKYINKALHVFHGKDNELSYFNNEKTSHHVHLSCGKQFDNPRVLYNLYVIWMIVEPLVLLSLPFWRRNNDRYCSSIYSTFFARLGGKTAVESEYMNLININLDDKSLYDALFKSTLYLRSITNQFKYPDVTSAIQKSKPTNGTILNPKQSDDSATISRMIIASVFQNYIGKPKARTQYKSNIARYSAFNALNTLNKNPDTHTVEIRIKHGSDDPDEINAFIHFLTEIFSVGIQLKDENRFINLTESQLGVILEVSHAIYSKTRPNETHLKELINIMREKVIDNDTVTSYIIKQIMKMNNITKDSMASLNASLPGPSAMEQGGGGGPRKKWVFCYGSNGLKQLRRRVKHKGPWEYRPVVLPKYARIFSASSRSWGGAVASIWPDDKSKVYGMVVKMNAAEIALLDRYEGTHLDNWYVQEMVQPVDAETGESYTAMAYINQDIEFIEPPSVEYLQAIEENLKNTGLSKKQIGSTIKINIINNDTIRMRTIGKWKFDTEKIEFTSKRMARLFDA